MLRPFERHGIPMPHRRAATVADADADLEGFVLVAGPELDATTGALLLCRAHCQRQVVPMMPAHTPAAGAVGPHIEKCYLAPMSAMVR